MDPVTAAALIGAGSSVFGSVFGSRSTASSTRETNAANLAIAREQMAFQERMDNSKYQRGVEDARKAGFNPLVAFPGSGGSPMGASAVMQNPNPNKGELFLSTAKALSDISLQRALAKKALSDSDQSREATNTERLNQKLLDTQVQAMQGTVADARNRRTYADSTFGKGTSWVKNVSSDIGSAVLGALGIGNTARTVSSVVRSPRLSSPKRYDDI